jgi:predicted alpha/beta hydrolase family esterase
MKKQTLFVQGAGKGAHEADSKLVASLRKGLGPSYRVNYPKMPESAPEYVSWRARIAMALAAMDGPVILVGHSVGASVLLKFASEEMLENMQARASQSAPVLSASQKLPRLPPGASRRRDRSSSFRLASTHVWNPTAPA